MSSLPFLSILGSLVFYFPGFWSLTLCTSILAFSQRLEKTSTVHFLNFFSAPQHSASKFLLAPQHRKTVMICMAAPSLPTPGSIKCLQTERLIIRSCFFVSLLSGLQFCVYCLISENGFSPPEKKVVFQLFIVEGLVWYQFFYHGQKQKSEIIFKLHIC